MQNWNSDNQYHLALIIPLSKIQTYSDTVELNYQIKRANERAASNRQAES
jgi:hypothetical protein